MARRRRATKKSKPQRSYSPSKKQWLLLRQAIIDKGGLHESKRVPRKKSTRSEPFKHTAIQLSAGGTAEKPHKAHDRRGAELGISAARREAICRERARRRIAIFATKRAGKGSGAKRRRITEESKVRC